MNSMNIQSTLSKHNNNLDAAEPIARKNRDIALREYQICPKLENWHKLAEACHILQHVRSLKKISGGVA